MVKTRIYLSDIKQLLRNQVCINIHKKKTLKILSLADFENQDDFRQE